MVENGEKMSRGLILQQIDNCRFHSYDVIFKPLFALRRYKYASSVLRYSSYIKFFLDRWVVKQKFDEVSVQKHPFLAKG